MILGKRFQGRLILGSLEVTARWMLPRVIAKEPLSRSRLRSLGNRTREEIRASLGDSDSIVLIAADEPVPASWPQEILAAEIPDAITWKTLTVSGDWLPFYSYSRSHYLSRALVPAYIYVRESPLMLHRGLAVAPVASTLLGTDGRSLIFAPAHHVLRNVIQFNPVAFGWRTAV